MVHRPLSIHVPATHQDEPALERTHCCGSERKEWEQVSHWAISAFYNGRFLGCVNLIGTTYEASTIATGFGAHLAQPILRKAVEGREESLEEGEAQALLEKCMAVLWYRDARSTDKVPPLGPSAHTNLPDPNRQGHLPGGNDHSAVPG